MTEYQQLKMWSPVDDCYVARISVGNDHGHELFMLVPMNMPSRDFRTHRTAALDAIQEAIDAGLDPGEVRVDPVVWEQMLGDVRREMV